MGSEAMGSEAMGSVTDLESALQMPNLNSVTVSDMVDSDTVDSDTEDSEVTAEVSEDISENDRSSVLDPFALMFHPHQQSNFCENQKNQKLKLNKMQQTKYFDSHFITTSKTTCKIFMKLFFFCFLEHNFLWGEGAYYLPKNSVPKMTTFTAKILQQKSTRTITVKIFSKNLCTVKMILKA